MNLVMIRASFKDTKTPASDQKLNIHSYTSSYHFSNKKHHQNPFASFSIELPKGQPEKGKKLTKLQIEVITVDVIFVA